MSENNGRRQFPIADEELLKGRRFTLQEVAKAMGRPPDLQRYPFLLVNFSQYIIGRMRALGRPATVRTEKYEVVICTDADAATYNAKRFKKSMHKVHQAHRRNLQVDRSQIPDSQRPEHDRQIVMQGALLSAIQTARRRLLPSPLKRRTPAILEQAPVQSNGSATSS